MSVQRGPRLRDVCDVQMGFTARGRLTGASRGGVPAIQMRDVPPAGTVDSASLTRRQPGRVPERFLVGSGDVLFRSRSDLNTALAIGQRLDEPAVAMLPLYILRPNRRVILPEFLAWTINQPRSQRHFDRFARGTNMRMIPRSVLTELQIALPGTDVQRRVVALDDLARRERTLSVHVAEKRRQFVTGILEDVTTRPRGSCVLDSFPLENIRHIFGSRDPKRTPAARRRSHGPADVD